MQIAFLIPKRLAGSALGVGRNVGRSLGPRRRVGTPDTHLGLDAGIVVERRGAKYDEWKLGALGVDVATALRTEMPEFAGR